MTLWLLAKSQRRRRNDERREGEFGKGIHQSLLSCDNMFSTPSESRGSRYSGIHLACKCITSLPKKRRFLGDPQSELNMIGIRRLTIAGLACFELTLGQRLVAQEPDSSTTPDSSITSESQAPFGVGISAGAASFRNGSSSQAASPTLQ